MDYLGLIIGFVAGACGSLVLWVTIGKRMMLSYAGKSVINAFKQPSDELKEALDSLMSYFWLWLNEARIEIDTPPDSEGKTTKTKISPLQSVLGILINETVNRILHRVRGVQGAATRDAIRMESNLASQIGIPIPRKGQTTTDFIMEQMSLRLMPMIEQKLNSMVENVGKGENIAMVGSKKEGW